MSRSRCSLASLRAPWRARAPLRAIGAATKRKPRPETPPNIGSIATKVMGWTAPTRRRDARRRHDPTYAYRAALRRRVRLFRRILRLKRQIDIPRGRQQCRQVRRVWGGSRRMDQGGTGRNGACRSAAKRAVESENRSIMRHGRRLRSFAIA